MADYIRNIILIGVACSLALTALPKNAEKSARYVRQMSAFIVLVVMLSPLKNISVFVTAVSEGINSINSTEVNGESSYSADAVIGKSSETICKYIIEICAEKFGMDRTQTRVKLILDDGDMENVMINEIQVFTPEHDRDVLIETEKYLAELFQTKVYVFGG